MNILKFIEQEIQIWERERASEELGGNIVKENYARGVISGLRIVSEEIRERKKQASSSVMGGIVEARTNYSEEG
jgi:hypothetical protein